MNTGFGGSADTRSDRNNALQAALLQHHHFGVLTATDKGRISHAVNPSLLSHAMPAEWVKGTMLVRCNTIARGHSAVSLHVIQAIIALIQNNMIPVVPLRGSISASGDLSPLSYIAGAVTGNPDISVLSANGIISAEEALQTLNISPIELGPKEGLGLMNGTATSSAVASLALYEAHHLTVMSHVLTAMAVEALVGRVESLDPFVAKIRPHRGQIESAKTIRQFLQGSQLTQAINGDEDDRQSHGIVYQDRYALRTASQWLGPQLEDLLLAHEQVTIELNSTTDNPLIDVARQTTHHGGNFQAVSITSSMEKTRLSLQMIGKLLFAQCSEMINPMLNNGLPPNLAADEPSLSYAMKGVDIGMASYMSELAFLANPVSTHVQSAEMHNQDVNSLAFISTRYTLQSVDLVSLMSASYLYTVCQALDLRVLQKMFFRNLEPIIYTINREMFSTFLSSAAVDELHNKLWAHIQSTWLSTSKKDTHERVSHVVNTALAILAHSSFESIEELTLEFTTAMRAWRLRAHDIILESYTATRSTFFKRQKTADYLGQASKRMYLFVRQDLGVPFHKGLEDHPTPKDPLSMTGRKQTIGSWIGSIYESLRSGQLHEPLMGCLLDGGLVADTDALGKDAINGTTLGKDTVNDTALGKHGANGTALGKDAINGTTTLGKDTVNDSALGKHGANGTALGKDTVNGTDCGKDAVNGTVLGKDAVHSSGLGKSAVNGTAFGKSAVNGIAFGKSAVNGIANGIHAADSL